MTRVFMLVGAAVLVAGCALPEPRTEREGVLRRIVIDRGVSRIADISDLPCVAAELAADLTAEERAVLFTDPAVRRVFETAETECLAPAEE